MCSKNNVGRGGANRKACTLVPSQANGNDSKASLERDRRQRREGRDPASALTNDQSSPGHLNNAKGNGWCESTRPLVSEPESLPVGSAGLCTLTSRTSHLYFLTRLSHEPFFGNFVGVLLQHIEAKGYQRRLSPSSPQPLHQLH